MDEHQSQVRPNAIQAEAGRGSVLVIDDDPWIRSIIAESLTAEGFTVEQAVDGPTGLRLAEQLQPDVILLDLASPMHSGLEVLSEIKECHQTRRIPIIVLSAYAMLVLRGTTARDDRLGRPPLDLEAVLDRVNSLLREGHPKFRLLPPTSRVARASTRQFIAHSREY